MSSDGSQTPGPTCAPGTLEEELDKIEREQSEVVDLEAKERELEELQQRARTLAGELRAARTARRRRSAEGALPVIQPGEPCSAAWEDMAGDERVRACGRCKARVYDLGGLDPSEARRLVSEREGRLPTHVVGRVDGTVTTHDCTKKKEKRLSPMAIGLAAFGAVGLLMSGATAGYILGGRDAPEEPIAVAEAPIELQTLVNELVEKRTQDALDRARADAEAQAKPSAPPPTEEPPARRARPREDDPRDRSDRFDQRRERRRGRCGRRGHIHMHSPLSLFFWESAFGGEVLEDCEDG